ncbi:T9SS type A sorting domain-containing protein [Membranihabitans marinus]|uniref:T9SS type A sorting domain-containing protein n=1 Tax=Membranihabitans marinus TaxID=1227546 RepID=UPI001F23E91B|nr:T9SS type A sorting domain-containing protein [Membranihabitans marinus]
MKWILNLLCIYILFTVPVYGQFEARMELLPGESRIVPAPLNPVEENGIGVFTFQLKNHGPAAALINRPGPGYINASIAYLELRDEINTDNSNTSVHGYEDYYDIYIYVNDDKRHVLFQQKAEIPAGTTITISLDVKVIQNSPQDSPKNGGSVNLTAGSNHEIIGEINIFTETYTLEPAPVELTNFEVEKKGEFSILNWNTVSEINNDLFEIERSQNGQEFVKIGDVKGHGNTQVPQSYTFVDQEPFNGINYYRLKQIDFDGTFDYSKILYLTFDETLNGDNLNFKLFPNPTSQYLNIVSNKDLNNHRVALYDVLGRQLKVMSYQSGMALPMYGLQSGLYSVHITDELGAIIKNEMIIHQSN